MKFYRREHVKFGLNTSNDDFDVRDKERPGQPNKFEGSSKNSVQTLLELSKALNVTPKAVSKPLHGMEKIHKEGIWLLHELSENVILNRLSIATSLLATQRKRVFCGAS